LQLRKSRSLTEVDRIVFRLLQLFHLAVRTVFSSALFFVALITGGRRFYSLCCAIFVTSLTLLVISVFSDRCIVFYICNKVALHTPLWFFGVFVVARYAFKFAFLYMGGMGKIHRGKLCAFHFDRRRSWHFLLCTYNGVE
jgi:hypothetical protein